MASRATTGDRSSPAPPSALALLVALAMVLTLTAILFVYLGVRWENIAKIPSYFLNDADSALRQPGDAATATRETNRENKADKKDRALRQTAGTVAGADVRLVCSDETFAAAVAKVRPAVVSISCESIQRAAGSGGGLTLDDPALDLPSIGGIGSGMIVDARGYVLTCYHIVAQARNITVTPFGTAAKAYPAQVTAQEEQLNLALIRIHVPYELPVVTLGDSALAEVADVVLAIGNPFGLEQTVTHGIISDNSRDLLLEDRILRGMLQTDAAINRGSSGGPLVNINGEVIGINMAIYSPTGFYNGVSFAMPINQAKQFLIRAVS
jgi:S1-C subfamily serine protease